MAIDATLSVHNAGHVPTNAAISFQSVRHLAIEAILCLQIVRLEAIETFCISRVSGANWPSTQVCLSQCQACGH